LPDRSRETVEQDPEATIVIIEAVSDQLGDEVIGGEVPTADLVTAVLRGAVLDGAVLGGVLLGDRFPKHVARRQVGDR
jgi:hypothetical protein